MKEARVDLFSRSATLAENARGKSCRKVVLIWKQTHPACRYSGQPGRFQVHLSPLSHSNLKIPFLDFGGSGSVLHFAHANGFPPACYRTLLQALTPDYHVLAMHQRPLWEGSQPDRFQTWEVLGDDLIRFLDENNLRDIIGVGHSMGGVATVIAAAKRPDLFSQLVLIDPVLFRGPLHYFNGLLPVWLRKKIVPIAKVAMKRKDQWPDKQAAYKSLRQKSVFRLIPDPVFAEFIAGSIRENQDGTASLRYSKEWEAQVYCTPTNVWQRLAGLTMPTLAIKADGTNLLYPPVWEKWQEVQPGARFEIIEKASHLVPLERPGELAQRMRLFLAASP